MSNPNETAGGARAANDNRHLMVGGILMAGAILLYLYLQNLPVYEIEMRQSLLGVPMSFPDRCILIAGTPAHPTCLSNQTYLLGVLGSLIVGIVGLVFALVGVVRKRAA